MNDQGFGVADIGKILRQSEAVNDLECGCLFTGAEGQQTAIAATIELAGNCMLRRILQTGIVDPSHLGMPFENPCQSQCVATVPLHPQSQGLDAFSQQERVERRGTGAHILVHQLAGPCGESEGAVLLVKLLKVGKFLAIPVEHAPIDDHATNGGAGAVDIFAGGVDHDICAQAGAGGQTRGRHRGVHNKRQARLMGDLRQQRDVGHIQLGVADRLHEQKPRLFVDGGSETFKVEGIYKTNRDAEVGEGIPEQGKGASEQ